MSMENVLMLAVMVSRAPVRAVSLENTATHMSVRSYLIQLCGYFRKKMVTVQANTTCTTCTGREIMVSLSLFFTGTPSVGKFLKSGICIFNRLSPIEKEV